MSQTPRTRSRGLSSRRVPCTRLRSVGMPRRRRGSARASCCASRTPSRTRRTRSRMPGRQHGDCRARSLPEARRHAARRDAEVGAVLVQPDALPEHVDLRRAQARVRARRARLRTVEARVDASGELAEVGALLLRRGAGLHHLLGGMLHVVAPCTARTKCPSVGGDVSNSHARSRDARSRERRGSAARSCHVLA